MVNTIATDLPYHSNLAKVASWPTLYQCHPSSKAQSVHMVTSSWGEEEIESVWGSFWGSFQECIAIAYGFSPSEQARHCNYYVYRGTFSSHTQHSMGRVTIKLLNTCQPRSNKLICLWPDPLALCVTEYYYDLLISDVLRMDLCCLEHSLRERTVWRNSHYIQNWRGKINK